MKIKHTIYVLAFSILIFFYFNDVFLFEKVLLERDLSVFFYPNIVSWVDAIKNSELPLWNPYIMCGEPLLASVQPAFLYPLSFLYLILPVDFAFNLTIVLHFFLCGIFTFLLMKELKASDEAASISAIIFTFSGYLLSVHNVMSTLLSVTWFPVSVTLFLKSLRQRSWKSVILCAFSLYCMFAGGGLEIIIMTAGILFLLALFPCLYEQKEITLPFLKRTGCYITVLLFFLLIGAVQILPFLELLHHSIRSSGISYQEATIWSLAPKNLLYLFAPDIFWKGPKFYWTDQSWLKTIYTGFIPFLLAAFFLLEKGKRRFLVVFIMAGAFFLSLGGHNPFYPFLFEWIPGLKKIRYPVKFFFIVIFFICLAAGWGWDYLQKYLQKRSTRRLLFFLFSVFAFFCSVVLLFLEYYPDLFWKTFHFEKVFSLSMFKNEIILHNIKRVIFFAIVGSTLLFLLGQKTKLRSYAFYGFIFLLLLDLFWGNYGHFDTIDKTILHKTTDNQNVLKNDEELFRFFVQLKIIKEIPMPYNNEEAHLMISKNIFCPNLLIEHKKFDIWGFSVLALKNYSKILSLVQSASLPDSTNLLNFLNVKYVLWSEELECPGYELIRKDNLFLYKNTNYLQRAFLVKNYRVLHGEKAFMSTLQSPDFDPSETVLLSRKPDKFSCSTEIDKPLKDSINIS